MSRGGSFISIQFLLDPLTWLSIRIEEGAVISRLFSSFSCTTAGTFDWKFQPQSNINFGFFFFFFLRENKNTETQVHAGSFCLLSFFAINFFAFYVAVGERLLVLAPPRLQDVWEPSQPIPTTTALVTCSSPNKKNPGLWSSSRRTARWPASLFFFFFFERWRINRN